MALLIFQSSKASAYESEVLRFKLSDRCDGDADVSLFVILSWVKRAGFTGCSI